MRSLTVAPSGCATVSMFTRWLCLCVFSPWLCLLYVLLVNIDHLRYFSPIRADHFEVRLNSPASVHSTSSQSLPAHISSDSDDSQRHRRPYGWNLKNLRSLLKGHTSLNPERYSHPPPATDLQRQVSTSSITLPAFHIRTAYLWCRWPCDALSGLAIPEGNFA